MERRRRDSGGPPLPERDRATYINVVSPRWFHTFGTRLLAGRDIAETDTRASPPVAIVNEAFARKFLNGRNPVGRHVVRASSPSHPSRRSRDRRLRRRRRLQLSARAGAADDVHPDSQQEDAAVHHVDQRARCGRIAGASDAEPGGGADGRRTQTSR